METKGKKMIKKFENFNRESFEELRKFFLELIDEGCEFEKWVDDGQLTYPNENLIWRLNQGSEMCFVKLIVNTNEEISTHSGSEKVLQRFLNKFKLGILLLIPQNIDISYIEYKKFFGTEQLQFIESVSGFKLSLVSRKIDFQSNKISSEIGMVFVR